MNATHIQDGHLIIEFMFGTPEGQIPETKNLNNEASQTDLSYYCGLHHFDLDNKTVQALLRQRGECECRMFDPIGNINPHLPLRGIARPRIDGKFGPKKDLGIVSKCGCNDMQRGLNNSYTIATQLRQCYLHRLF